MLQSANFRRTSLLSLLFATHFGIATAQAAVDIAQSPLETGAVVPPNILFVLDDSGSMRWGFMPDELSSNFNLGSGCSSSNTTLGDVSLKPCRATGRRYLTSSHLNTVYYNPATVYEVPLKPDGVNYYPTPSFTSAPFDGYNSSSAKVDLSNGYLAFMDDYYYPGFAISSNDSNQNKTVAYYHDYIAGCTPVRSDSCYTLRKLDGTDAAATAAKKNFAIWFSFYRTRLMLAKAGVSAAFHTRNDEVRVGYGALNSGVITADVATFGAENRIGFFNWLHTKNATGSTPLLGALKRAGDYFISDTPWRVNPGVDTSALLECRQNYTILMTDGYYGDTSSVGAQDSVDGPVITGPGRVPYQYKAEAPFSDGKNSTLADVAMRYWKNDLRSDLDNTVAVRDPKLNPAFWQHMVTFGVGLGVSGSIANPDVRSIINKKADPGWWNGDSNQNKINDLIHASVNSRGGFFSANEIDDFKEGLSKTLAEITGRQGSASNVAATAVNALKTASNIYQARFESGTWQGDLWSYSVTDVKNPIWKASEKVPAPSARTIVVGNGSTGGRNFLWDQLTSTEKTSLGNNENVLLYLRGDRTKEESNGGIFRNRGDGVLGDFVNSSPELVAEPVDMSYNRYSWEGASLYRAFIEGPAKSRAPMIYVGGNDGMIHGFNANTGVETFAFIPKAVLQNLPGDTVSVLKKYSEPSYLHRFSVDGSPTVADVYINNKWTSVLVGGLGRGGNSLYAIDVTDPSKMAPSSVLWDKSFAELGIYLGKPQVYRMKTGQWAIVAGYGYNNSTHKSGIIVINIKDGNVIAKIPTAIGTATEPNGMSEINTLDLDNDGNVDWVYGGDLHGKVWRFDVSNAASSAWTVAYNGSPLFEAFDKNNKRQKITGGVLASIDEQTGKAWVFFGTGSYISQNDPSNNDPQTWYGVMDGTAGLKRANLEQRIISTVDGKRVIATFPTLTSGKKGWFMDLTATRERIVDIPSMIGGELVMNTTIPDTNVCNPTGSGYIMAVSPYTGGRLKRPFFDIDGDGKFDAKDKVTVDGKPVDPSGFLTNNLNSMPTFARKDEDIVAVVNCESANLCARVINPAMNVGLQSWHELNN